MKDKGRKKRKNKHVKKRFVTARRESCNKAHTGVYYLKIGARFRCGKPGH